eukprot:m.163939 g.163939  ORF g.163939 m.163939 type:complete len:358 (-) comp17122_c0_seq1:1090-2163(-)
MDLAEHIGFASYKLPSFFELVAQESMLQHAQPAIDYVAKVLASRFPSRCQWMLRVTDELYLLLSLALNRSSLWSSDSSIAESYYSLVRVSNSSKSSKGLSSRLRWLSLAVLVLLPYLQTKLKRFLAREETQLSPRLQRLARAVRVLMPYVSTAWQGTDLVLKILYLFEKTRVFSTSLLIAGVHLERSPEREAADETKDSATYGADQQPTSGFAKTLQRIAAAAPGSVNTALFFMTFVEWWYSSEHSKTQEALPPPPPPAELQPVPSALSSSIAAGIRSPITSSSPTSSTIATAATTIDRAVCPLCKQPRTSPTALAVSGFVYCYRCVHTYVSEHGKCPMTQASASLDDLIRLYVGSS